MLNTQPPPKPYALSPKPSLSLLTARILAVNLLPLVLLVGSILYLSGYQDRLIHNELDSMSKEARQFSAALGEAAVVITDDERDLLAPELARLMLRRLMETTETRTRLFDVRGSMFADSLFFPGPHSIESESLPPPESAPAFDWRSFWYSTQVWLQRRSWSEDYPAYKEKRPASSADYPIVDRALDGDEGGQVWMLPTGHILLGVAVPVQRYKVVLGAVLLTRGGMKIEEAVEAVRIDIIRLFLLTLVLTILLSLYLARAISRPLQELSRAAEGLKAGQVGALKWQGEIPDFSKRGDEIGDLSAALRAMVKTLGERMHAIESFAADVAHEIKNPLTSLHSAAETAIRINDPVRQRKLLEVMAEDVRRLDRLISDISQASRVETELGLARAKRIDLAGMLAAVTELYTGHDADLAGPEGAGHGGARPNLVFRPAANGTAFIEGVEGRLVQVFQNLIDNALSFSPPNGMVRIDLVMDRTDPANDREPASLSVHIIISDEGPGIPEGKLEAIFDRFYSQRPSHEAFGRHSGLGLSIARQIVEAHRGRITAGNIRDGGGNIKGACFTIDLPLARGEEE